MIARRLISALFIALIISGLFTFWLSRKFAKPHVATAAKQQYVAAAVNLDAGEMLRPVSLKLIDWPISSPLQGAFLKPEDVAGRVVLFPLAAGEPILDRQLSAPGTGAGLAVKIPEGMRALALRSNDIVGVAGYLLPGTHVDVLVTYKTLSSPEPMTATILQDAQVLTAGQKMQPDPEGKASTVDVVTLLVKPQDAERVVLASSLGTVHFILRNGSDREQVKDSPAQVSELGGAAPKLIAQVASRKAGPPAAPGAYVVETIAGTKQSVESFK